MALLNRLDALCAPKSAPSRRHPEVDSEQLDLADFEAELHRLAAANEELLHQVHGDTEGGPCRDSALQSHEISELDQLRAENAELSARLQEFEAHRANSGEDAWLERQREYEMLMEEKSEVIRGLHQRIQEMQESALGDTTPAAPTNSGTRLGQAEEIIRLKREIEEQRQQVQQDEEDMMAQMRQMELSMAKERAEMARQRQELQRQKDELMREIENASRDPELRERLSHLRRHSDPKPAVPGTPAPKTEQNSSSFFRRIFG